ncbi:hypothetical protein C8F01DRAFT_1338834 [Mycena amicta]|nr:hypothetical protein C8F01DRAFT_1338834 [Mycena amicta]
MRAIVVTQFGAIETSLKMHTDVPTPKPKPTPGYAIIKIKVFGVNHAEMHMRRGEWAESMPIIGIECVGVVISSVPASDVLTPGTLVATLMGGLGRTINGPYAKYTSAQINNIVPLSQELVQRWGGRSSRRSQRHMQAPAYTCLFGNIDLRARERLLVRGASSAFGHAAIALAVNKGAVVSGTVRSAARVEEMRHALGVKEVFIEEGAKLTEHMRANSAKFDKILELVGNSTVLGSMDLGRRDGRVCLAGWLGGLDSVEFNPLLHKMATGVHLSFFASFALGEEGFPLGDVPLKEIGLLATEGKLEGAEEGVCVYGARCVGGA